MLVRDAMTTDVKTVEADRSLRQAVEVMLDSGIGSVVATDGGDPAGIVTETDVLQASYASRRTLDEIPVAKAMSRPLVTVAPSATIQRAVREMTDSGVKKLGVAESLELVGILTRTDVVDRQRELVKEIQGLDSSRGEWHS